MNKYCKYIKSTGVWKPLPIQENVLRLVEHYGIEIRYNNRIMYAEINVPSLETTPFNRNAICMEFLVNKLIEHNLRIGIRQLEAILLTALSTRNNRVEYVKYSLTKKEEDLLKKKGRKNQLKALAKC